MDLPLAAYGTIRPGCGGQENLGLSLEDLGFCTLKGRLWLTEVTKDKATRLTPALYPEEDGVVEARILNVPEECWGKIDAFVGFVPHDKESPYIRKEIETLEGESAWVYCAQNLERINFLRDGDWVKYASHPKAIPLFPANAL